MSTINAFAMAAVLAVIGCGNDSGESNSSALVEDVSGVQQSIVADKDFNATDAVPEMKTTANSESTAERKTCQCDNRCKAWDFFSQATYINGKFSRCGCN